MNNFRIAKVLLVFSSLSYLSVSFLKNYNSPENIEKRCILKFEKDFKNNLRVDFSSEFVFVEMYYFSYLLWLCLNLL